jgi:hypothetical protein
MHTNHHNQTSLLHRQRIPFSNLVHQQRHVEQDLISDLGVTVRTVDVRKPPASGGTLSETYEDLDPG